MAKPTTLNYKKLTALLALSLFFTHATAETSFPRGCEVIGYGFNQNDLVINDKGTQAFYMIQNRSDRQIELEHIETRPDVFMSPKLETKLAPQSWAAFASDIENMHFRCYTRENTQENNPENSDKLIVNCQDAIDVCQYPRVKFALSNMGNYWISTNKPREQVIKDAVAKGILLRW